jgi:small subunit ribosomal protein S14
VFRGPNGGESSFNNAPAPKSERAKRSEPGGKVAKQALIEKAKRTPKFKVRAYHRCNICGRARGFMRDFGLCRVCFREFAHKGLIPGVTKSSGH